jgi:hypothetical protein
MPIIPNNISEIDFDERDLFLNVSLTTITLDSALTRDPDTGLLSGGDVEDFTGRPTFKTGFWRDGVGFGITNIKISTNASLQPTVDIEFKDLYGKTVFGELNGAETGGISYAALFQWPPPKFEFTFKGYLGCPVTWLLNMKTTSTQYNADDGSYTIKATFIPNQWGMFADIPFLYLYAVKKLKQDTSSAKPGTKQYERETESVIDLMYTGKKLAKKTERVSKEYDKVYSKLQLLKRDVIGGLISGTFSFDDPDNKITSSIPSRNEIEGFKDITISRPPDNFYKSEGDSDSAENIVTGLKSLTANQVVAENLRIKIAASNPSSAVLTEIKFGKVETADLTKLKAEATKIDGIIDENIKLIDNAVKAIIYKEDKEELRKLTISEVFSRIAKDAAYIMGYILDAGEQGYINNLGERNAAADKGVIGLYYPMEFEAVKDDGSGTKDLKKQVPAKGLGTDEYEKSFVSNFITAVSYGIAQNRSLQAQANVGGNEDKIINRVSNLELISSNPFLDIVDWKEFASIIMKRAAVISHVTKSYDPNYPGGMEKSGEVDDNGFFDGNNEKVLPEDMRKAADADVKNVTDAIIANLEPEALEELKNFCKFWIYLINDPDGIFLYDESDTISSVVGEWFGFDAEAASAYQGGGGPDGRGKDYNKVHKRIIFIYGGVEGFNETTDSTIKQINDLLNADNSIYKRAGMLDESNQEKAVQILKTAGVYDEKKNIINLSSGRGPALRDAGFLAYTVEQYLEQFIGRNYMFYGRSARQALTEPKKIQFPTLKASFSFYNTVAYYVSYNGIVFFHGGKWGTIDDTTTINSDNKPEYVIFTEPEDIASLEAFSPTENESDSDAVKDEEGQNEAASGEEEEDILTGINIISNYEVVIPQEGGAATRETDKRLFRLDELVDSALVYDYSWAKTRRSFSDITGGVNSVFSNPKVKDAAGRNVLFVDLENIESRFNFKTIANTDNVFKLTDDTGEFYINPAINPIAYAPYATIAETNAGSYVNETKNRAEPAGSLLASVTDASMFNEAEHF